MQKNQDLISTIGARRERPYFFHAILLGAEVRARTPNSLRCDRTRVGVGNTKQYLDGRQTDLSVTTVTLNAHRQVVKRGVLFEKEFVRTDRSLRVVLPGHGQTKSYSTSPDSVRLNN